MREVERRVEGTGGISEEVGRPDTAGCGRAVVGRHWEMLKERIRLFPKFCLQKSPLQAWFLERRNTRDRFLYVLYELAALPVHTLL